MYPRVDKVNTWRQKEIRDARRRFALLLLLVNLFLQSLKWEENEFVNG